MLQSGLKWIQIKNMETNKNQSIHAENIEKMLFLAKLFNKALTLFIYYILEENFAIIHIFNSDVVL